MYAGCFSVVTTIGNVFVFCLFKNKFYHKNSLTKYIGIVRTILFQWTFPQTVYFDSRAYFSTTFIKHDFKRTFLIIHNIIKFSPYSFISSNFAYNNHHDDVNTLFNQIGLHGKDFDSESGQIIRKLAKKSILHRSSSKSQPFEV